MKTITMEKGTDFYLTDKDAGLMQSLVRVRLMPLGEVTAILRIDHRPFSDRLELSKGNFTTIKLTDLERRVRVQGTTYGILLNGTFLFQINSVSKNAGTVELSISSSLSLVDAKHVKK